MLPPRLRKRATFIKPSERLTPGRRTPGPAARRQRLRGLGRTIAVVLTAITVNVGGSLLSGCGGAPALALVPWSPILSGLVANRGGDWESRQKLNELDKNADWPGMFKLAQGYLKRDPTDANWLFVAGYAQFRQANYAMAIEVAQSAVSINPEDLDSWNLLAEALRLSNRAAEALPVLQRASMVGSSSPQVFFLLGETLRDLGRNDEALAAYRDATRLEPRFDQGWLSLGLLLVKTGQLDDARAIAQQLNKLNPALATSLKAALGMP